MVLSYPDPPLGDDVVRLRPWTAGDLDCVRQASSDPSIPAHTSVPSPFSERRGRAYLDRQHRRLVDGEGVSLAIVEARTDLAVGSLWLAVRPQPGVWGLGYWLTPDARGRGRGTRAVVLASEWLLGGGAARIEAWVEPDNLPSRRILSAARFTYEGVLRAFLPVGDGRSDAAVFSLVREDTVGLPPARPETS